MNKTQLTIILIAAGMVTFWAFGATFCASMGPDLKPFDLLSASLGLVSSCLVVYTGVRLEKDAIMAIGFVMAWLFVAAICTPLALAIGLLLVTTFFYGLSIPRSSP